MIKVGSLVVLIGLCAPAFAATSLPDCTGLSAWSATVGPDVPFSAAATVPAAYADTVTEAAFGARFTAWDEATFKALDAALNACRGEAQRAKDAEGAKRFAAARTALNAQKRLLASAERARTEIAQALAALDKVQPSPALAEDLAALAAAEPTTLRALRLKLRETGQIARTAALIPLAELAELQETIRSRAGTVAEARTEALLAEVAAIETSRAGLLTLRRLELRLRTETGAETALAAAHAREAELLAALAGDPEAPLRLPSCEALLAWAEPLRPGATRRARAGLVLTALEDPGLERLFGRPFGAWSAADLDTLSTLAGLCRDGIRSGGVAGEPASLSRGAAHLSEIAARAADQPRIFAALAASRAEATAIAERAASAGIAEIAGLRRAAQALEETDALNAAAAVEARRAAFVAEALAAPRAAMTSASAGLPALDAALAALDAAPELTAILTRAELDALRVEAAELAARSAEAALPAFSARLDALAADVAGLAELDALAARLAVLDAPALEPLRGAVTARRLAIEDALLAGRAAEFDSDLAAIPQTPDGLADLLRLLPPLREDGERLPTAAAMAGRAAERAESIRRAAAAARCAPLTAGLKEKDRQRPTLIGTDVAPLARLLCALGAEADGPPRYTAPGLFGSDHIVEATVEGGYAVRLVLTEAEAPKGGKALIGRRLEDGDGQRDLGVAEWQSWSGMLAGGAGACADFPDPRLGSEAARMLASCLIANPEAPLP